MLVRHINRPAVDRRIHKQKELLLTPGKVEACTDFRPGVAVPKEIGNGTSAKIAEEAHWTPNPGRLDTAAIAKCEENVSALYHVVRNKHVRAGRRADKGDTV